MASPLSSPLSDNNDKYTSPDKKISQPFETGKKEENTTNTSNLGQKSLSSSSHQTTKKMPNASLPPHEKMNSEEGQTKIDSDKLSDEEYAKFITNQLKDFPKDEYQGLIEECESEKGLSIKNLPDDHNFHAIDDLPKNLPIEEIEEEGFLQDDVNSLNFSNEETEFGKIDPLDIPLPPSPEPSPKDSLNIHLTPIPPDTKQLEKNQ